MKVALAAFLLLCLASASFAETLKCHTCGKVIEGKYFRLDDKAHGDKVDTCATCVDLETRCFACGLPVKANSKKLTDGRYLCDRDAKEAILDDAEAKTICLEAREEMDRMFSRFLSFPTTNVLLTVVDKFTLESLFKSPGFDKRCNSVFGATRTHQVDGKQVYTINILSGLSRARLQAVAAHEFSHTWLNDNLKPARKATLSPDAVEAFCEFIAYHLMDEHKEEFEKKTIKENPYTNGQLDAFLAAEGPHGFNTVLEWVKAGETAKLDPADPDNVRQVDAKLSAPAHKPEPLPPLVVTRPPVVLPEKLVLMNIGGTSARKLAIINNRTFGVQDAMQIPLAKTNLMVRCLEIRTNSVLVLIENTGEKQELKLPQPPYSLNVRSGPLTIERSDSSSSPTKRD